MSTQTQLSHKQLTQAETALAEGRYEDALDTLIWTIPCNDELCVRYNQVLHMAGEMKEKARAMRKTQS